MSRVLPTARQRLAILAAALLAAVAGQPAAAAPGQRPLPPLGSLPNMVIPPLDAAGVRRTVNTGLSPAHATWNLRSALNVAALNCYAPKYRPVVAAYKALLGNHAAGLAATNARLDREYRERFGAGWQARRDATTTRVYNYFALPSTLPSFCDAALEIGNESLQVPPAGLEAFAARSLPRLEQVFESFFRSYDQYRLALASWEARQGGVPGSTSVAFRPAPRADAPGSALGASR